MGDESKRKPYFDELYDAVQEVSTKTRGSGDQTLMSAVDLIATFIDDTQSMMTGKGRRCPGPYSPLQG